jgi:hypothetical protein
LTILNYKIKLNLNLKLKYIAFYGLIIISVFEFFSSLKNKIDKIENTIEILEKIVFIEMEKSMASRYYTRQDPLSGLTGVGEIIEELKKRKEEQKKQDLRAQAAEVYKTGDPEKISDFSIKNPEMADILSQVTAFKSKKTEQNYKDSLISFFISPTEKNAQELIKNRQNLLKKEGVPPEQSVETDTFLERFRQDPEGTKQQVAQELAFRYPEQWKSVQKFLAELKPELPVDERTDKMKEFELAVETGFKGSFYDFLQKPSKKPVTDTPKILEHKYAKSTGYTGNFMDFISKPIEAPEDTPSMKEYKLSVSQGFKGTFLDFEKEKINEKKTDPAIIQQYKLAQEQGYPGTIYDFVQDNPEIEEYKLAQEQGYPGSFTEWKKDLINEKKLDPDSIAEFKYVKEQENYKGTYSEFLEKKEAIKNATADMIEFKYVKEQENYKGTFLTYQASKKDPVKETTLIKEFKFAQEQGYEGSYLDYQKYLKDLKVKDQLTPKRKDYEYAVSQGYPGTFLEFQQNISGVGTRNKVLEEQLIDIQEARENRRKKAEELKAIKDRKTRILVRNIDSVLEEITKAEKLSKEYSSATGLTGWITGLVPSTPAYILKKRLATIQANIGFDKLDQMRASSPTGGALGQVSERELDFLMSTITALDPAMGREELLEGLLKVEKHYNTWRDTVTGKITEEDAQRMLRGEETDTMEGYGIPVIKSDEQYNNLESGTEFYFNGKKRIKR